VKVEFERGGLRPVQGKRRGRTERGQKLEKSRDLRACDVGTESKGE